MMVAAKRREHGGTAAKPRTGAGVAAPAKYQCDPLLWVSWLYHHDELTQSQIADLLGVSRATIANYLQQAKANHYVKVSVRAELLGGIELATEMKEAFGLAECMVIPDDWGLRLPAERIGKAAAQYLEQTVVPGDVLGVAWGRTVLATAESLADRPAPNVTVVQVVGSQRGAYDGFGAEECASLIALKFHARTANLHAPAVLTSRALRETLSREPIIQEQFQRIRSCNKLLFGVCTVKENSLVFASHLTSPEESKYFVARGAVGVIAGRFFDAQGRSITGDLDERLMGITLDDVRQIPTRIAVAGGVDKTEALLGALKGQFANVLITDEQAARSLLARR
jgi:DNA-binding transcriptional regulator LsrR (DeoR family)